MVPYPAGAASDVTARALNGLIGQEIGGQVIVENLGGASGAIAANKVLGAAADGYYLFQGSPNELILAGLANKGVKHKPEDFEFVAPVATSPLILMVNAGIPADTLDEFVALARRKGKNTLNYGSPGAGSLVHLMTEMVSKRIGVPMTHVPYKGGVPLVADLIGGQIDFAILPYQANYEGFVKQGRVKIIGTFSKRPLPLPFQSIPTIDKSRVLADFDYGIWTAYLVKKGTDPAIVERLNAAIAASLRNPAARAVLEAQGKTLFDPMSIAAGKRFYEAEIQRYRAIFKASSYEPE